MKLTAEELNAVRNLKEEIRALENRLQIMRLTASSISPAFDGLPGGNEKKSPVETLAVKIISLEEELSSKYRLLDSTAAVLYEKISAVNLKPREHDVMILRYCACETFRDIGFMLKISDARTYALHSDAVKKILDIE